MTQARRFRSHRRRSLVRGLVVLTVELLPEVLPAEPHLRIAHVDPELRRAVDLRAPRSGSSGQAGMLGLVPVQPERALRWRLRTGIAERSQAPELHDTAVSLEPADLTDQLLPWPTPRRRNPSIAASASYLHSSLPRSQAVRRAVVTATPPASSMSAAVRSPCTAAHARRVASCWRCGCRRSKDGISWMALRGEHRLHGSRPRSCRPRRRGEVSPAPRQRRGVAASQAPGSRRTPRAPSASTDRSRPACGGGSGYAGRVGLVRGERSIDRQWRGPSSRTASRHQVGKRCMLGRCPNGALGVAASSTGAGRTSARSAIPSARKRPLGAP